MLSRVIDTILYITVYTLTVLLIFVPYIIFREPILFIIDVLIIVLLGIYLVYYICEKSCNKCGRAYCVCGKKIFDFGLNPSRYNQQIDEV